MNRARQRAAVAVLAVLAYLPALTAAPGRMPSDSKLYLYLDPGRFMGDAAGSFDGRQFAGWVPHQHIAYLWPSGPWFWLFDALHVPDWIAHRLWIGTLMVAAGLGVRWCARLLGLGALAAFVAALTYQVSPYVLPYVSRTSVMLLPWAGLGWLVGFTIRAGRRRTWGDPAAIALIVFTVGAVNATALAMIVPAPALWLLHAAWQRSVTWRQALVVAARVAVLTVPVCLWWMAMLVIQGRSGAEVLPYSESLADVSLTATGPEIWRGLGYWLFYVRDPYAATTTASLRYLSSTPAIVISYAVPIVCLAGLAFVRWAHRRFAALLIAAGAVLAIGVHPIGDRSPLMRLVAGDDERGLALALRSSTRALPLMNLGLALVAGSLVAAIGGRRLPALRWGADRWTAGLIGVIVLANMPALWTGGFVDPALERDQSPPDSWDDAVAALDRSGDAGRVLQLPGAEFGAFRWGYTVDQPLPGLADKPLVTRDLLPLGSPGAMDLLYALDDRIQDGVLDADALAPIARLLGVDTIWLANDLDAERFRTATPAAVGALVAAAPGIGDVTHYGTDVDLYPVDQPGHVVRAAGAAVVVSGSGDGLVDASAAGLIDGTELTRYSASLGDDELAAALDAAVTVIVTDSNRDRARHWRSSQDTTGYTESDQPELELLRHVASDQRLPVFAPRDTPVDPATQTVARQLGPVRATATSYGEPFAYLPERRPYMAIDGDPATAWTVGEHTNPLGETLRLVLDDWPGGSIALVQATGPEARQITAVTVNGTPVALDATSSAPDGQAVEIAPGTGIVDITVTGVTEGPQAVGFAEIVTGLASTVEVVRPPVDALAALDSARASVPLAVVLTRLRTDPADVWRSDPEPELVRQIELAAPRSLGATLEIGVDARATDAQLASLFGWPVSASTRLTGSIASAGLSALDGDPTTAWVTAEGAAVGASLNVALPAVGSQSLDRLTIHQPAGRYSMITSVSVRSGDVTRDLALDPDEHGVATVVIDPPLPPGPLELVVTGITEATRVDRRYGDTVQLPAAISEIELPGVAPIAGVAGSSTTVDCAPALDVDGVPGAYSWTVTGAQLLDGGTSVAMPCDGQLELTAGAHRVRSALSDPVFELDRVVLTQPPAVPAASRPGPTARVVERSRYASTIEVDGCPDGCWLVFGEGYNTAWIADGPSGSLGDPAPVDGGFNGWWIDPSSGPVTIEVHWTRQRPLDIALAVSVVGVLAAVALFAVDRRRRPGALAPGHRPVLAAGGPPRSARRAVLTTVALAAGAALLVAPVWAVWGIVAGAASWFMRRARALELMALSIVIVVGALVTAREWRNSPLPDGGWPSGFESWHRLAVFAVVAVLIAAVTADDADADQLSEPGGYEPGETSSSTTATGGEAST